MFREELPRVNELRDLIEDPSAPGAYFQNFDNLLRDHRSVREIWLAREQDFRGLDAISWQILKNEVRPYLMRRDQKRGWEQLFTILNQARAYNFLRDTGCSNVQFIPRASREGAETPDLRAELNGSSILCEVKTINISDEEASARTEFKARAIGVQLGSGFFKKLTSDLRKAKGQIDTYARRANVRRLAYLVVNFDDFIGDCKEQHFEQIDRYLAENPTPGIDVVFHNQRTPIHKSIVMAHATIVNE